MRKLFALLLAAVLVLCAASAVAEENASIVRVTNITLSYVGEGGASSASFENASLLVALGHSEGAPTLQLMFDSGEGQAVDAVMQIVDDRVLFTMGGLSATYAVGLDRFATGGNTGADVARGITQALDLAGAHLDVVLYAVTREGPDGMRALEAPVPMPQLMQVVQAMLSLANGVESAEDAGLGDLQARVDALEDEAHLGFRYSPETGAFELAAIQNGMGMRLAGSFTLSFEPMTFIDITTEDTEICDLMNLTEAQSEELQGELGMLFPKFIDFAGGAGLNGILP